MTTGRLRGLRDFRLFWTAATVSDFGTHITILALQVLVVVTLDGTPTDVGLVSAARWAPYLVLGIVAGVLADRMRRRPVLVWTDLGRGVLLGAIPLLAWAGQLTVPLLAALLVGFGTLSLLHDASHQSFPPRIVPRPLLARANARLHQSDAAAQTSGPVVAGGLVSWLGAPLAVLVDAASFVVSAVLTALVRAPDPRPVAPPLRLRVLAGEALDGLRWVYGHRRLLPLAVATHGWFAFFAVLNTVYAPFALRDLGLSPFDLGVTLACTGVGGLLGSTASTWLAERLSPVALVAGSWALQAVGFALIAVPSGFVAVASADPGLVVVAQAGAGQFLVGVGFGAGGPIEMAYRQSVTPDRLQGRTNSTMRSINRAAVVVAAPLGGLLAELAGTRVALWVGTLGLALAAAALWVSPFRAADLADEPPEGDAVDAHDAP